MIKKISSTCIMVIAFFAFSKAQGVDFGLKAGLNISTLSGIEDLDIKSGLHGGAFLCLKFSKKYGISTEVLFSQQGAESEEGSLKLNYVNVPVMLRISPVKFINLHLGPQFGFLMSATKQSQNIKELYKNSDLGLVGGLGLDLPLGILCGARYNVGLSNLNEDGSIIITNQYFQFYLGYSLF